MSDNGRAITIMDLARQGDPGTLESDQAARNLKLMSPFELYSLWEKQQWISQEIDFSQDRRDWEAMAESERREIIYSLSGFFVGEERVAHTFAPYVMAAEDTDEESFAASLLVDESRHAQFFDKFFREVIGGGGATINERIDRARKDLTPAFTQLFDDILVNTAAELGRNPTDRRVKTRAITLYNIVIEGTLAITGQHFITKGFQERGILPGFVEGFIHVADDEHRHVAYGTWYLQKVAREGNDELIQVIHDTLAELLPITSAVMIPPKRDRSNGGSKDRLMFGHSAGEVNEFAFTALSRRLKAIGVGLPTFA